MKQYALHYAGGREAARPAVVFTQSLTLAEVVERCGGASRSTRDIAHAVLRQAEVCAGHAVLVAEVDTLFCCRLVQHMRGRGLSDGTQRTYLERLGALLHCVQDFEVPDLAPLLPPRPRSAKWALTEQEAQQLRDAMECCPDSQPAGRAFRFALQTALRFVDIKQLGWGDIRHDAGGWYLQKRMQKTGLTVQVPLSTEACLLLRGHLDGKDLSEKPSSGLVFGDLPSYSTVRRQLRRLGEEAGLGDVHLTFHVARHTFASELCHGHVPLATISKLLGHSSLAVTERYIHSFRQDEQRAVNLMSGF